jgi:hypothetical protein
MTLTHEGNNVREFYSKLPHPVRVGIEATGSMQFARRRRSVRESSEKQKKELKKTLDTVGVVRDSALYVQVTDSPDWLTRCSETCTSPKLKPTRKEKHTGGHLTC